MAVRIPANAPQLYVYWPCVSASFAGWYCVWHVLLCRWLPGVQSSCLLSFSLRPLHTAPHRLLLRGYHPVALLPLWCTAVPWMGAQYLCLYGYAQQHTLSCCAAPFKQALGSALLAPSPWLRVWDPALIYIKAAHTCCYLCCEKSLRFLLAHIYVAGADTCSDRAALSNALGYMPCGMVLCGL